MKKIKKQLTFKNIFNENIDPVLRITPDVRSALEAMLAASKKDMITNSDIWRNSNIRNGYIKVKQILGITD